MSSTRDATVLIAPDAHELRDGLASEGLQVINWPDVALQRLKSSPVRDDALENLYGYDWLIFVNDHAVAFFLEELRERGHKISDLDSPRSCAIGEPVARALERMKVHVDVVVDHPAAETVILQLTDYVGGPDLLRRLNFLIPQATVGRDYLKDALEDVGARADVVANYQTVTDADMTRLVALQTMLQTGSIDAIVFCQSLDIETFAVLFDTRDLQKLLNNAMVVSSKDALETAAAFGLSRVRAVIEVSAASVIESMAADRT